MKVLVVDVNRWYARKVKETIEELAPSVKVDTAANVYEVQSRLKNPQTYQLILADIRLAARSEEIAKLIDTSSAIKILWSAVDSLVKKGDECKFPRIQKPANLTTMKQVVEKKILQAVQASA